VRGGVGDGPGGGFDHIGPREFGGGGKENEEEEEHLAGKKFTLTPRSLPKNEQKALFPRVRGRGELGEGESRSTVYTFNNRSRGGASVGATTSVNTTPGGKRDRVWKKSQRRRGLIGTSNKRRLAAKQKYRSGRSGCALSQSDAPSTLGRRKGGEKKQILLLLNSAKDPKLKDEGDNLDEKCPKRNKISKVSSKKDKKRKEDMVGRSDNLKKRNYQFWDPRGTPALPGSSILLGNKRGERGESLKSTDRCAKTS